MKFAFRPALVAFLALSAVVGNHKSTFAQTQSGPYDVRIARFETMLERLRMELKIPAYSAALVKDQKVIWAKGFGYADLENKIPATEHTAYHLASLTKTFGSTILMQLVQEGKVKLDDPVSKYGINLESEGVIRVRHLFSHTSEGIPGEQYRYNGNRYAELDKVVQRATGKSFAELLISNILEPLGMDETAPNVPRIAHTKSSSPDPAAEAEIKTAVMDIVNGYNAGNVDQIEKRLAPENNRFPGEGRLLTSFIDAAEMRQAFQAGLKINFEVQGLETAVYGPTAVSTFIMSGSVTPPNGTARPDGPWRASFFWNKQDGVWKLVHSHQSALSGSIVTEKQQERFDRISKILAKPYGLDRQFNPTRISYPQGFSVSAGLISTVLDMAKYDIAIDQNKFLTKETQQLAFTPAVSTKGGNLPYGLGWFTTTFQGLKMLWHYGYWTGNSSFILKVPEKNLTFIIMANSDNLSRPTDLGAGDVTSSVIAMAFLKTFIFPEQFAQSVLQVNWNTPTDELRAHVQSLKGKPSGALEMKELITWIRIAQSVGRTEEAVRLTKIYSEVYSKPMPADLLKMNLVAEIVRVLDNEDKTVTFRLDRERQVRIFSIGEGQAGEMFDYGWIENVDKGFPVWEMQERRTTHAGGANKNRQVDETITLPAGNYKLRYKSDDSHAFDHWNSLPPDVNFWGIAIYTK
ncbi:MAG TPA: serine hydrolase domain-containing protein [Pyrinomonadaceae bacterium]|nr:serine hydrolase domain-containing protein [Pyrinomonadaceae bacterium]